MSDQNVSIVPLSNNALDSKQPYGGTATNRAPENIGDIPPVDQVEDTQVLVDVSPYFSDPDGDVLTFTADVLPAGLSLSTDGMITGIATTVETVAATITATDPGALFATAPMSFDITAAPVVPGSDYPLNYPNRIVAAIISNWEERLVVQPWQNCCDVAHAVVHQGTGMYRATRRANTVARYDAWRARNPKGHLLWHVNYRWTEVNPQPKSDNKSWRVYDYIVEQTNMAHIWTRREGDIAPGKSNNSTSSAGAHWNLSFHHQDYRDWIAQSWWGLMDDQDDGGTGVNSIVHLHPFIMNDNTPSTFNSVVKAAATKIGVATIKEVISQTRFKISQFNYQDTDDNLFTWNNAKNATAALPITSYATSGGDAIVDTLYAAAHNVKVGDEYLVSYVKSQSTNVEFDDPPSGIDYGNDPEQRKAAAVEYLLGVEAYGLANFGFGRPPVSNGLGGDNDSYKRENIRTSLTSESLFKHGFRQCENWMTQMTNFKKSNDDLTYVAKSYNADLRDWMLRSMLWGEKHLDLLNPSSPASELPVPHRGVFYELDYRKQGNVTQAAKVLDEYDAAWGRFYWALFMSMRNVFTSHGFGASSPIMQEESFYYPGDPADSGFPHNRTIASCKFDIDYGGVPEPVVYRTPDWGNWGFLTAYPGMLVGLNLGIPKADNRDPWYPHYHPNWSSSLDPVNDVVPLATLNSFLNGGEAWYKFNGSTYVNPVGGAATDVPALTGPAQAPWTDTDAVVCKDFSYNDGAKIVADLPCGPLESFALFRGVA